MINFAITDNLVLEDSEKLVFDGTVFWAVLRLKECPKPIAVVERRVEGTVRSLGFAESIPQQVFCYELRHDNGELAAMNDFFKSRDECIGPTGNGLVLE